MLRMSSQKRVQGVKFLIQTSVVLRFFRTEVLVVRVVKKQAGTSLWLAPWRRWRVEPIVGGPRGTLSSDSDSVSVLAGLFLALVLQALMGFLILLVGPGLEVFRDFLLDTQRSKRTCIDLGCGQVRSMPGVHSSWSFSPKSTTIFELWPTLGVTTTLSTQGATRLAAGGILNLQGRMRGEIGVMGSSVSSSLSSMMMCHRDPSYSLRLQE